MLVKDKSNGLLYAMKKISKKSLYKYCSVENLKKEIKIQRKIDHPHIIKLYFYFEDKENVYLILEYAENGSLFNSMKKTRKLTERQAFVYFFQTCLGIDYLHKRKIIHRDLKPENLLLDKAGNIKICDFGWSTEYSQTQRTTFCGTIEYMAPEMIKNQPHNFSLDIWCLGILLYELLHGKPPYGGKNDQDKCKQILNKKVEQFRFQDDLSEEVIALITMILKHNPSDRPSLEEVFMHPWMKKMQKECQVNYEDYLWESKKKQPLAEKKEQEIPILNSHHLNNSVQYGSNKTEIQKESFDQKKENEVQQKNERKQKKKRQTEAETDAQQQEEGFFTKLLISLGCMTRDKR